MAREYGAAVLHAKGALEEALYKVAPCSEEYDGDAKTYPLKGGEACRG